MSKHFGPMQMRGLNKMGDIFVPGDSELASFSGSRCAEQVDRILDYMPASDLKDLKLLMTLLSFLPTFMIAGFLGLLELSPRMGDWIGPILRFIRIGLRGLVLTLYYSHPQAHRVLGYQVGVYRDDLKGVPTPRLNQGARYARLNPPSTISH